MPWTKHIDPVTKTGVAIVEVGGYDGVNSLGKKTRLDLYKAFQTCLEDADIHCFLLVGAVSKIQSDDSIPGRNFSAGADITEFSTMGQDEDDEYVPNLIELLKVVEDSKKPVVAAISGVALGGGLELALACHVRMASMAKSTRLGLPESQLGLIPGAGGTQRLPRLLAMKRGAKVGIKYALKFMINGNMIGAKEAFEYGILNERIFASGDEGFMKKALEFAVWYGQIPSLPDSRRLSQWDIRDVNGVQEVCAAMSKSLPPKERGGEASHAVVEAVKACTLPTFEESMEVEGELFMDLLLGSSQGKGRRHAFFATRSVGKYSKVPPAVKEAASRHVLMTTPPSKLTVGVVGAGLMGSGIAMVFLYRARCAKVVLADIYPPALEKGVKWMESYLQTQVKKQKITAQEAAKLMKNLVPSTSLEAMAPCQLVVEAVVEKMAVKKKIFSKLDQVVASPHALLLSNTSTLDIDEIASSLPPHRRPFCAGLHFFSPAQVMKLVEIIYGSQTAPETLYILQHWVKKYMSKVGVTVGNIEGFVGNRMVNTYSAEACLLLGEGQATVASVDQALLNFGMVLGPFQMGDLAGNDIGYYIRMGKGLTRDGDQPPKNRPASLRYTELGDDMVTKLGRLGQKSSKGWYNYDPKIGGGRKPLHSPEVSAFIAEFVKQQPKKYASLSAQEIVERTLFPLVNEGFKLLEMGIAEQPSDIDVIYMYGYGFPPWRGGPMFWADNEVGLKYLLSQLERFYEECPGSPYFEPSALLRSCVEQGITVEKYYKMKRATPPVSRL
mmetsp:Transcript_3500/g.5135  ORF Transcript_3500/g.5135 Transcript_3500/m.5135 type:complete len:781 (-) Transcript_3500:589-2931(-)